MTVVVLVPEAQREHYWHTHGAKHLAKCVALIDEFSLEDIYQSVCEEKLQLWMVVDEQEVLATFTTCIQKYPRKSVLELVHLGGSGVSRWGGEAVVQLNEFAKWTGCSELVALGRKGLEKMYKQFGFTFNATQMKRTVQ